MITAYKWYCIARSNTIGSSAGVKIDIKHFRILAHVSVDWGNVVLTVQETNLTEDITGSLRLRKNGNSWYLDVKISQSYKEESIEVSLYDNDHYDWYSYTDNELSGSTICLIEDVASVVVVQNADNLWAVNADGDLYPKDKEDGTPRNIISYGGMSFGGNSAAGGNGGGEEEGEGGTIGSLSNVSSSADAISEQTQILVKDSNTLEYVPRNIDEIAGFNEDKLAEYLLAHKYVTEDYLHGLIFPDPENNAVRTALNLVVEGGVSFGGVSEGDGPGGGGGLTSITIKLGDTEYVSDNGIVSLPAYPTNISELYNDMLYLTTEDLSDYITKDQIEDIDTRLKAIEALWAFDTENNAARTTLSLIVEKGISFGGVSDAGGESGGGTIKYPLTWSGYSSGSFDGSVSANIVIPTTLPANDVYTWAKQPSLLLSDIPDLSSKYLTLSGGTISSNNNPALTIKRNNGKYDATIRFENSGEGLLGYLGISGSAGTGVIRPFYSNGVNTYDLIHSGNIGSQSVASAGSANLLTIADIRDTNPTPNDVSDFGVSAWFSNVWNPTGATWNSGISVKGWADNYAVWQLAASSNYGGNNQELYFRLGEGTTWNAWRRLLFNNDDNARFLNSSIVSSKYNTALTLQTNFASKPNYTCGLAFNCLGAYSPTYENHTHAWIGLGPVVDTAAAEAYPLVFAVNGDTTTNANPTERMRIFPNGNVAIGTIADNGVKLDVVGGQFRCMAADVGTTYGMHHGFITGYHGIDVMQFFEDEYRFYSNGGGSACLVNVNGTCSITGRTYNPTIHTSDNLAYYGYDNGEIQGTIKITLPNSWNSDMSMFEIWVYDYNSMAGSKIFVSGYSYSGTYWYNTKYAVLGNYNKGVRLAHDGSKLCILLGNTSSYWEYPQIYLKARSHGYTGRDYIHSSGYSISLITDESSFSTIQNVDISDTYTNHIIATRLSIDASYGVSPTAQGIVINTTNNANDYGWNPGIGFHIPGVTYATIKLTNDSLFRFFNSSLSGYVGIVTGEIYAYGNITITGEVTFGSDARYKDKIKDTSISLKSIAEAPLFTYRWNDRDDDRVYLGTTAQYWLDTPFKYAVNTTNPDFLGLGYGELGVAIGIVNSRKLLNHESRITTLERDKEKERLKKQLKKLQYQFRQLEKQLQQYRRALQ